jgi:hypothetical protein
MLELGEKRRHTSIVVVGVLETRTCHSLLQFSQARQEHRDDQRVMEIGVFILAVLTNDMGLEIPPDRRMRDLTEQPVSDIMQIVLGFGYVASTTTFSENINTDNVGLW